MNSLEPRQLLTSFATLNGNGTVNVVGGATGDLISVERDGNTLRAQLNGESKSFAAGAVRRIWLNGFGGDDRIENRTNLPSTLIGHSGTDTLIGGEGQDRASYVTHHRGVTAFISPGEEGVLTGQGGQSGTTENDQFFGIEELEGSRFADSLSVVGSTEIPILVDPARLVIQGLGGNDEILGNTGFNGSPRGVDMHGDGGDDHFLYFGGDHRAYGGIGDDVFERGDDDAAATIEGGAGHDTQRAFYSSAFADVAIADGIERLIVTNAFQVFGSDRGDIIELRGELTGMVFAGAGNDWIDASRANSGGGAGGVTIHGEAGNDTVVGSNHGDSLTGGAGHDLLLGRAGDDALDGNEGNDRIFGGSGNDILIGGGGRDLLHGQAGNDLLLALDGERDTLDGGAGFDSAASDTGSVADLLRSIEARV